VEQTQPRARFWLAVATSGVAVGALSVAFHSALDAALAARERLDAAALVPVCAVAVALAIWLTARFAPHAAGSGIQHVEGVERGLLARWRLFPLLWVKFVGGVIGIGAGGLLLGREGPTVQMGATLADHVGARFGLDDASRKTLLAVGAGAGLAGAFNAPLAGVIFVAEELKLPFRPAIYLGTLFASLLTEVCCRLALEPLAEMPAHGSVSQTLAPALVVGALAGALGAGFNAGVLRALAGADRLRARVPGWALGAALGVLLAIVAVWQPALPGGGVDYAERVLSGSVAPAEALPLLLASFVLTLASYAIGAPGGVFAPLLVIGAFFGQTLQQLVPAAPLAGCAVAGMAGIFAGVVRAPLTGAVLLFEMTGSSELVPALVAASLAGHAVANRLKSAPLYESLLEREVARSRSAGAP